MVATLMNKEFDERIDNFFRHYQDRGMKKWAGYFLSDHTLKINQERHKSGIIYHKRPEMTVEEIGKILLKAFADHYQVSVQLRHLNGEKQYLPDIRGFVEGCSNDQVIVAGQLIKLSEINNVLLQN